MTNKITSLNIRNNGNFFAICGLNNQELDLTRVGLIALPKSEKEKSYQLNCYGVKPFSARAIQNHPELDEIVEKLLESKFRTGRTDTINKGKGLKVYFGDRYSGLISIGKRFDERTIWNYDKRELVNVDYLGLGLKRYSSEVKPDFENLRKYLNERNMIYEVIGRAA